MNKKSLKGENLEIEKSELIEDKFSEFQRQAFFYKNQYYLLPEDCKTYEEFCNKYKIGDEITATKLLEKKCQAPYFVEENMKDEKFVLDSLTFEASVFLMTKKEYNKFLRDAVNGFCDGCPKFTPLSESDDSLIGHHEEISLDSICNFRELAEKDYSDEFVNYDDYMMKFINFFEENASDFEKLIDAEMYDEVHESIENEFWESLDLCDPLFFVGKKEYSSKYYFYYSAHFDDVLTFVMKIIVEKLQKSEKLSNWEIKDYIPKGYFAINSKKPSKVDWDRLEFERTYFYFHFDESEKYDVNEMLLWIYGAIGEDTFRSFCEGCDFVSKLKNERKIEELMKEIEDYGETLPSGSITYPQAVVSGHIHNGDENDVGICTSFSTKLMDLISMFQNGTYSEEKWIDSLYFYDASMSLFDIKFQLKKNSDMSAIVSGSESLDLETIMGVSNYFKETMSGQLFSFELWKDSFYLYGLVFNIAKFKNALHYLSPILKYFDAKPIIYKFNGETKEISF